MTLPDTHQKKGRDTTTILGLGFDTSDGDDDLGFGSTRLFFFSDHSNMIRMVRGKRSLSHFLPVFVDMSFLFSLDSLEKWSS